MSNKKDVIRFMSLSMGIYVVWYVVYELWLYTDGRLDSWLSVQVARGSSLFLNLIGYDAAIENTTVYIEKSPMVFIGNPCNGLVLMALFAGFVMAFPGPVRRKLLYIPVGIISIFVINTLRVVALALTAKYSPEMLDFNHKYTFTFIVYACIFGMWMLWVKKFSNLLLPVKHADVKTELV